MKIYKYKLDYTFDNQTLKLPRGSRILTVDKQGDDIMVWASVSEDAKKDVYAIHIVPTGLDVPAGLEHNNTIFLSGLVLHAFIDNPRIF